MQNVYLEGLYIYIMGIFFKCFLSVWIAKDELSLLFTQGNNDGYFFFFRFPMFGRSLSLNSCSLRFLFCSCSKVFWALNFSIYY